MANSNEYKYPPNTWNEEQEGYRQAQKAWISNSGIKPGDKAVVMHKPESNAGGCIDFEMTDALADVVGKTVTVVDPYYTAGGKRCYLAVLCEMQNEKGEAMPFTLPFFTLAVDA